MYGLRCTLGHVESARLELAVLLAERAGLAAEVDAPVGAGLVGEPVAGPQPGAVAAGVEAAQPRRRRQQEVERPARAAGGGPLVHDAGDPPEGDARAEERQAACGDRSSASNSKAAREASIDHCGGGELGSVANRAVR